MGFLGARWFADVTARSGACVLRAKRLIAEIGDARPERPSSCVFDAPTGETCAADRNRSVTPLQALTVLNDEMYLELARALGQAAWEAELLSAADRAALIFRRVLTRPPEPGSGARHPRPPRPWSP